MQVTKGNRFFSSTGGSAEMAPAILTPERHVGSDAEQRLNISVIFTTVEGTLAALRAAATLANRLIARITLVVPEVVPYHRPLDSPPVNHDWNKRRFRVMAANCPVETSVRFYLCRDAEETLARELTPHSVVVIGGKKRWWPTAENRLAGKLRRLGHEVILTETE